jgi:thiol-disulfide isomerase/thioredoxin
MRRALAPGLALVAMLAGCGLQQDLSQAPTLGAGLAERATPISTVTLTGARFNWSVTHDHVVVLDFWGSWCVPCRAEQPELNSFDKSYASKGVIFLGVDLNDTNVNGRAYERDFNVPYASVNDSNEVIASDYNVPASPTVVAVNAQGLIVDRFLGTLVGVRDDLMRLTST